MFLISQLLHAF